MVGSDQLDSIGGIVGSGKFVRSTGGMLGSGKLVGSNGGTVGRDRFVGVVKMEGIERVGYGVFTEAVVGVGET